jgi:hypothetical protein
LPNGAEPVFHVKGFGDSAVPQADIVATLVLSQLEGALLLARTYRSLEDQAGPQSIMRSTVGLAS